MENSKIQWTTHTWNPWYGCSKISPGCAHCYAEVMMDKRYGRVQWGPGKPRKRTALGYWRQPLAWNKQAGDLHERYRIFPSLCDPFDHEVSDAWRNDFFRLIEQTPNLDWLLLTKRAEEMLSMLNDYYPLPAPLPANMWLGVSVENQEWANKRRDFLAAVRARIRFVSYEPAIGPVAWTGWEFVDQIIVGGESGPGARYFDSCWAADTLTFCRTHGIAFFMKQKGSNSDVACRDHKGGDPAEWPQWCRVREFPDQPRLIYS